MAQATTDKLVVKCVCGTAFRVPAAAAGKKAKCSKCGHVLVIPTPEAAQDDSLDALEEFAASEQAMAATAQSQDVPATACPGCNSALVNGAVLCTACGYDTRTGQRLATATKAPAAPAAVFGAGLPSPTKPKAKRAGFAIGGSLPFGVLTCGIACLLGAGLWFIVAKGTGYEIGWIAWIIGGLAGIGMTIGTNNKTPTAGLIAAGMAVGAIVLAKLLVFNVVVAPTLRAVYSGDISDPKVQEELLTAVMREVVIEEKNYSSSLLTSRQEREVDSEAAKRTKELSPEKRGQILAAIKEETDKNKGRSSTAVDAEVSGEFFSTMFGIKDIVFVILALATAFKVAATESAGRE